MMLGLCIHSFLEGMPLAGTYDGHDHNHSLLTGIILHHLPVAFALVSMLSQSGLSKKWTLFNLGIFARIISHTELLNISSFFHQIMAVVIGIFLHISTTILFESGSNHRFNLYKLSVILLGALLAILT